MTRLRSCLVFVAFMGSPVAAAVRAQAIDSISVALDTRYRWRSYERESGAAARTDVSIALGGFSTSHGSGDLNNWRVDFTALNSIANPLDHRAFDQYEGSLSYGRCLSACLQGEWIKRFTLNVAANEYALPNASGNRSSTEAEVNLRGYWAIEKIGTSQLGANLYPFVTIDRDFQRYRATYARAGLGTYLGPIGALGASLDGAVALSDWPDADGASRSFSYHGTDVQLSLDHDCALGRRHLSTRLIFGLDLPARSIGPRAGMVTLRFKLMGPVLRLR